MTPEELGLTEEEATRLDRLSPEQRHAAMDQHHAMRAILVRAQEVVAGVGDTVDTVIEDMAKDLPHQPTEAKRESMLDIMTSLSFTAESMRAYARNEMQRGEELSRSGKEYRLQSRARNAGNWTRRPGAPPPYRPG